MKLRLSVIRKAGAPGYGSDGASAEVEVEIAGTAAAIAENAPTWFLALEQAVGAELTRMQAAHPQPAPQPQPAHRSELEPRWNGKETRPLARRPEPGYDDEQETSLNGRYYKDRQDNQPKSGKQLMGWAANPEKGGSQERVMKLKRIAKSWGYSRVIDMSEADVDAAFQLLSNRSRTAGSWEGR